MPGNFAALEAARLARDPRDRTAPVPLPGAPRPDPVGTWSVARVYDDGRREPIRLNMSAEAAERLAGELRDAMTDADCAKGYNVLAQNRATYTFKTAKDRAVVNTRPSHGRGAGRLPFVSRSGTDTTPGAEARREKARKAGRMRWANR